MGSDISDVTIRQRLPPVAEAIRWSVSRRREFPWEPPAEYGADRQVDEAFRSAGAHSQQRLAVLQNLDELAADENHRRMINLGAEAIIDDARLAVGLPNGTTATIALTVSPEWPQDQPCQTTVDLLL